LASQLFKFSTTIRNPSRYKDFLQTITKIEGLDFNEEVQARFQILLTQDRLYQPMKSKLNVDDELLNKYLDKTYKLSYEEASDLLLSIGYTGGLDMRGRQSSNPLNQLGLVIARKTLGKVVITEFGKEMLGDRPVDYLFIKSLLKVQYPNPRDKYNKYSDGYNTVPFISFLKFLSEANKLNYKKKGLTQREFGLFVTSIKKYNDIEEQVSNLIEFRETVDKTLYIQKFARKFYNVKSPSETEVNNFGEYGDNLMRVYRMTKLFSVIRPTMLADWRIDFDPSRIGEIHQLLKSFTGESKNFEDEGIHGYIKYLADTYHPQLPWETKPALIEVIVSLKDTIQNLLNEFKFDLSSNEKKFLNLENYSNMKIEILNDIKHNYIAIIDNMRKTIYEKKLLNNIDELDKIIVLLDGPVKKLPTPDFFEKLISDVFLILGNYVEIKPNYVKDSEYNPISHAPGGAADIECYYQNFNFIIEVTKMGGSQQAIMECEPVSRHLYAFNQANNKKDNYLLFVAPNIHDDTYVSFYKSVRGDGGYGVQHIIPISCIQLSKILKSIKLNLSKGDFEPERLENLFKKILRSSLSSKTIFEWKASIQSIISKEE